ncbi:DUF3291 domain-containing protein [Nocardiopsis sp. CNT312]|uniref:DUF3291 domain-containing protein n=1 Tax=Nocardiopsis sp. CNT312 TaxID=1137268 RepID=UPI00048F52D3|nr:DUF3291 domain-containing protein [Nocardiopsis sp. CNT312]
MRTQTPWRNTLDTTTPPFPASLPTPRTGERGPTVLAEALTVSADADHRGALALLTRALRDRAQGHPDSLGEVHTEDRDDGHRTVALWTSPVGLRDFVTAAHTDLLAFRERTGVSPTVERTLWWARANEVTGREALRRSAHLREHGPGPGAFTLRSPVPPPSRM